MNIWDFNLLLHAFDHFMQAYELDASLQNSPLTSELASAPTLMHQVHAKALPQTASQRDAILNHAT